VSALGEAAVDFGRYPLPKEAERLFPEETVAREAKHANGVVEDDLNLPGILFDRFRKGLSLPARLLGNQCSFWLGKMIPMFHSTQP
jgi:hypothetical protein